MFFVDGKGDQAISGVEGRRCRRTAGRVIAALLRNGAGVHVGRHHRGHQDDIGVEHGQIDVLAFAGALLLVQRRRHRIGSSQSSRIIDDRRPRLQRTAFLGAGDTHETGPGLDHTVVGRMAFFGAAVAVGSDRHEDHFRIDLFNGIVINAAFFCGAAAQVLHYHIAFGGELEEYVATLGRVQIQRQETLVRRLGHETQRQALLAKGRVGGLGTPAHGFTLARRFDLDDFRAQQRQLIGAERPGQHAR